MKPRPNAPRWRSTLTVQTLPFSVPHIVQGLEGDLELNSIWKIAGLVVTGLVLQGCPHREILLPAAADGDFEDNPVSVHLQGLAKGFQAVEFGLRVDHLAKVHAFHFFEAQGRGDIAFRKGLGVQMAT